MIAHRGTSNEKDGPTKKEEDEDKYTLGNVASTAKCSTSRCSTSLPLWVPGHSEESGK